MSYREIRVFTEYMRSLGYPRLISVSPRSLTPFESLVFAPQPTSPTAYNYSPYHPFFLTAPHRTAKDGKLPQAQL